MACESALCCFNSKTALNLEKTNLILTAIGLFLYILKLLIIPWGATSYTMEFLAVENFIFLAINLCITFLFFMLRLKNMVNDYNYKTCLYACCIMILISFFGFIFEVLQMFIVLEDLYYYTGTYYTTTGEVVVSDAEWFVGFFTIVPTVFYWLIILMLWASEFIRVRVKTSGSYEDYMNESVDIVIINKNGKNNVNNVKAYDNKGQKVGQKAKDGQEVSVKKKDLSQVSITYA